MRGCDPRTTVTAAVLALVAAGCGGSSDPTLSSQPSSAASSATGPASPTPTPSPSPSPSPVSPKPAEPTFSITYAGGRVTGDTGRLKVKVGTKVVIRVTSDVADEVHLHGYDVSVKVAARGTALLSFTAKIPGVFELELEKLGKQLAKVQVQ